MWSFINPKNFPEEVKCIKTTLEVVNSLKVKVSETAIAKYLEEHPDFPSLLSIADCLENFGVNTLGLKISFEKLQTIPTPILTVHENNGVEFFQLVTGIDSVNVVVWDSNSFSSIKFVRDEFLKTFTGKTLALEPSTTAGESYSDYRLHRLVETKYTIYKVLIVFLIALFITMPLVFNNWSIHTSILSGIYFMLKLLGLGASILLLWYELDKHNPFLQQICTGVGKKSSCNTVLESKYAKFFGLFTWSEIGFAYFLAGVSILVLNGLTTNSSYILMLLSVPALLYIPYSIYYQYVKIKIWCPLCLLVQGVLFAEGLLGIYLASGISNVSNLIFNNLSSVYSFVGFFAFIIICWEFSSQKIKKAKEANFAIGALSRIKNDPQIFTALLEKQKQIDNPPSNLGITIGNLNARTKIVKVCNPYCGPCAKAHTKLDALLAQLSDISVQIIFNTPLNTTDRRYLPTKHLLAIAQSPELNKNLHKALDSWYGAPVKDYDQFAKVYPLSPSLNGAFDKGIEDMHDWCIANKIAGTPTIFINGYQLPKNYKIDEITYILKSEMS